MSPILRDANFVQSPVKNLVLERKPTAPPHPVEGQVYYNTSLNEVHLFSQGEWYSLVPSNVLAEAISGIELTPGPQGPQGDAQYLHLRYSVNADGSGMVGSPIGNTKYIGIAVTGFVEGPALASDYTWQKFVGDDGDTGPQGIPGAKGEDGKVLYTWLRYADDASGTGISNDPTGKEYIGFAYNKENPLESNDPEDYIWSLIKGDKGDTGVQGAPGVNGVTTYTWIKYSDHADGTDLYDIPTGTTKYIGIAVNKTTATESNNKTDYTWSLFKGDKGDKGDDGPQGIPGTPGSDGITTYTWVRYANDASGTGISNNPAGKEYIGFAYNKTTATESDTPGDYKWSLIRGPIGNTGVAGAPGADGVTTYTWIKYSDYADGTGLYDEPRSSTRYLGIAVNKTTASESNDKTDYTWSLFKGDDGPQGPQGIPGAPGADGQPTYTWIKYADTPTSGMSDFPTGKKYIGIAHNKLTATESNNYADYDWALFEGPQGLQGPQGPEGIQGPQGPAGVNGSPGVSQYIHIRYSTSSNGNPMVATPTAATKYIGLANTTSSTAPTGYASYTWQKYVGDDGATGIQGPPGANGQPTYTWVKYADTPTTGMSDAPAGKKYIGLAFNKLTAAESTTYGDYAWSLMPQYVTIDSSLTYAPGYDPSTKRRVFTTTPTTPYDVGDLWVAGSTGDIKKCKTARASGAYVAGDWELASKYTDNSAVTTLANSLKALAYSDAVEFAMLGDTIQEGGYIKTELLDATALNAQVLSIGAQSTNLIKNSTFKNMGTNDPSTPADVPSGYTFFDEPVWGGTMTPRHRGNWAYSGMTGPWFINDMAFNTFDPYGQHYFPYRLLSNGIQVNPGEVYTFSFSDIDTSLELFEIYIVVPTAATISAANVHKIMDYTGFPTYKVNVYPIVPGDPNLKNSNTPEEAVTGLNVPYAWRDPPVHYEWHELSARTPIRRTVTFTMPGTIYNNKIYIFIKEEEGPSTSSTFFSKPQLEKGRFATPYRPHPEEFVSANAFITDKEASFKSLPIYIDRKPADASASRGITWRKGTFDPDVGDTYTDEASLVYNYNSKQIEVGGKPIVFFKDYETW